MRATGLVIMLLCCAPACSRSRDAGAPGSGGDSAPSASRSACDAVAKLGEEVRIGPRATAGDLWCKRPAIAWAGAEFVVVYDDLEENERPPMFWRRDLWFVRQRGDGDPVGSRVRVISSAACPSLVWNGTELALSWRRTPALRLPSDPEIDRSRGVAVSRLDISGSLVDTGDNLVVRGGELGSREAAPIVGTGDGLAVVALAAPESNDYETAVFLVRTDRRGRTGSTPAVVARGEVERVTLASSGNGLAAAWEETGGSADNPTTRIRFARLDDSGRPVGSGTAVGAADSFAPALAWAGSEFVLVWVECPADGESCWLSLARFDAGGDRIGSDVRVAGADDGAVDDMNVPAVAWTGGELGLAWGDSRHGNGEIYFARVTSAGELRGPELRVTVDAGESESPAITWSGTSYGLAWSDERDGKNGIYFVRVGCP